MLILELLEGSAGAVTTPASLPGGARWRRPLQLELWRGAWQCGEIGGRGSSSGGSGAPGGGRGGGRRGSAAAARMERCSGGREVGRREEGRRVFK
jgi:hypothetical protein